jgi:hypothetical protein
MKLQFRPSLLAIACLSIFFTSCSPDRDYLETTQEIVSRGQWAVAYFYTDQDKTAQFSNYTISFPGNGEATVTGGSHPESGLWNVVTDSRLTDLLTLRLLTQDPVILELNGQWVVTDKDPMNVSFSSGNRQMRIRRIL